MKEQKFKLTKPTVDPETGAMSSDVEYIPDMKGAVDKFNELLSAFKSLQSSINDPLLGDLSKELQLLRNKYRTHLRKNYPEEYKNIFNETSITGGEGYMTKTAFKSKKELKEHIKQQILKIIKEELTADPKQFHQERINTFDKIEKLLNELHPYLSDAKNKTIEYYKTNPTSFDVLYPTDIMEELINEIKTLLTK